MARQMTTQKDWAADLDRRDLNHATMPLLLVALAVVGLLPTHDPYLAMATPVEYWSRMIFRFMLTVLGAAGVYALWIGLAPHGLLTVFPGYKRGSGSAKAAARLRAAKQNGRTAPKTPAPEMAEEEAA